MSSLTKNLTKIFKNIDLANKNHIRNQIRNSAHFNYYADIPASSDGECARMNMFQAINNSMELALSKDSSTVIFGEDVAFGGVFRCTIGLQEKFGKDRVFNTPLCEQGLFIILFLVFIYFR